MKIARLRQTAIGALAVLLISGAGIAFAGNSTPVAPMVAAPAVAPAAAPVATPAATPAATPEPVEPAGPDTDTLQQGDQTTPDTAPGVAEPAEAAGAAEPAGTETEAAGAAEEPGDASLPGGGHADDPNDPTADHQFEGVE